MSNKASSDKSNLSKQFNDIIKLYLEKLDTFEDSINPELEVRFNTKNRFLSKINFDNVIKYLLSKNFKVNESFDYMLRINNDNSKHKSIRLEMQGINNIQNYCKNKNIDNFNSLYIDFVEKKYYNNAGKTYYPVDFNDFNFRVSFQTEKTYEKSQETIQSYIKDFPNILKTFRYLKRFTMTNNQLPFKIHLTIVKNSQYKNGKFIGTYLINDSNIFDNIENYEIEIELDNVIIKKDQKYKNHEFLLGSLREVIKYILSGIQQTNFPIGNDEINKTLFEYLKIIGSKKAETKASGEKLDISRLNAQPKDFIGPSSNTLQIQNILPTELAKDYKVPNIRSNYCVTDKADGDRKLLFINSEGKIYLINTQMNIQFTGSLCTKEDLYNTLIDGEHIIHDKNKLFINLFAAFDIYYVNGKNVSGFAFVRDSVSEESSLNFRFNILSNVISTIKPKSIIDEKQGNLKLLTKKFYSSDIFNGSFTILQNVSENLYNYETDGLIFTPTNTSAGGERVGKSIMPFKITWKESFKWKPAKFNTIDFLIKIKKNSSGNYSVGNIFTNGTDLSKENQIISYYTLILHVGYDEKKHGYINPCLNIIEDKLSIDLLGDDYRPMQFFPTNPTDYDAGICNIILKQDGQGSQKIFTEEGEEIEDNSIIEFSYMPDKDKFWRWHPLRVRYDKTNELRQGYKNYGNAYHVANSNWQSIHYPITNKMISTGTNININSGDDDTYYNRNNSTNETKSLRDFHNLFVKSLLIKGVSSKDDKLFDLACGKGGDISKWINAELGFVLGIDANKDNIRNRLDGACARYLNYYNKMKDVPSMIFLHGNSTVNIKDLDGIIGDKNKQIMKALYGSGNKNRSELGDGIYKNFGIANNGFDIVSTQFAIHYMFEDKLTLHGFLKNVSENCKLNGYFIGTCFDGLSIFNMLNSKALDDTYAIYKNDSKIWQITKKYSYKNFDDDETSLGYAIDIYQESINKTFREYLVNFDYLTRVMETYGFIIAPKDDLIKIDINKGIGSFADLYKILEQKVKSKTEKQNYYGTAINMSTEEKKISFLNKYFIFKKVRNVDTNEVYKVFIDIGDNLEGQKKQLKELEKESEIIDNEYNELLEQKQEQEKGKTQEELEKQAEKATKKESKVKSSSKTSTIKQSDLTDKPKKVSSKKFKYVDDK
tara:strand:+ start:81 stop:3572 length:3492 start_codon:yes stop_codon:yes gene_type:complete